MSKIDARYGEKASKLQKVKATDHMDALTNPPKTP
jgi:hypothetical protein